MFPKMSDEKTDTPVMIVSTQNEVSQPPEPRSYRKYVVIAVTGIVLAAIILTAILVGVYFSTEAQKEILKFSFNLNENSKQDVISDPNTNIVQYHVSNPDYEMWAVNDFNRDIQVMKIQKTSGTNCYVTPLNRTMAVEPSQVIPPSNPQNKSSSLCYEAADTAIPDPTFLSKAARDTCKLIAAYWAFPKCHAPNNPSDLPRGRQKRAARFCFGLCW